MSSMAPETTPDGSVHRADRSNPAGFEAALDAARDYRGDVTLELSGGTQIEGFVYDRSGGATDRKVRLLPKDGGPRQSIPETSILAIAFTGKDAAAGKTWENWVKRYAEKRLAGEKACLESERLD
jgi:hypothetical protein